MSRTSKKSKVRQDRAKVLHKDAAGMTVADVRGFLRERVADWPFVEDVDDQKVIRKFIRDFNLSFWQPCWLCGKERHLDVCHIVPRSDERANLVAFCSSRPEFGYSDSCHALTEKNWAMLPEVLLAKLKHDPQHTSFMAIAVRRRQHFTFTSLD